VMSETHRKANVVIRVKVAVNPVTRSAILLFLGRLGTGTANAP
jgi:hypothetical protein